MPRFGNCRGRGPEYWKSTLHFGSTALVMYIGPDQERGDGDVCSFGRPKKCDIGQVAWDTAKPMNRWNSAERTLCWENISEAITG
jgi:hypothetical protein